MSKKKQNPRLQKNLFDILSSTRLAIYLLITLLIACIIGMLVPQIGVTIDIDQYFTMLENPFWATLSKFGFFHVFSSFWFLSLVGLMLVNLILCSIKGLNRIPGRLAASAKPLTMANAQAHQFFRIWKAAPGKEENIRKILSGSGTVNHYTTENSEQFRIIKGALSMYAPYIIHLSIIVMVAGAMVDQFYGLDGKMNVAEKSRSQIFSVFEPTGQVRQYRLPFIIKCDQFDIEYYEGTSRPKDYKSTLAIIEDGKEVYEKTIEVNSPLVWKGFRIFQSSYGKTGAGVSLSIMRRADSKTHSLNTSVGITETISDFESNDQSPDSALPVLKKLLIVDIKQDFQGNGPAAKLAIETDAGSPEPFWIFLKTPEFDDVRNGTFKFQFKNFENAYYTGLLIVRKPGATLIWIGCALFMISLCWGFFVPYRRIWLQVDPECICFAGESNRFSDSWKKHLEKTAVELEVELGQAEKESK